MIPWHWHEELELGYVEAGTSMIRTLGQKYVVHQGDGFFINTNVADTKRNGIPGKPCIEINHLFHPFFLGGHFGNRITTKYLDLVLYNRQITVHVIRRGSAHLGAGGQSNLQQLHRADTLRVPDRIPPGAGAAAPAGNESADHGNSAVLRLHGRHLSGKNVPQKLWHYA